MRHWARNCAARSISSLGLVPSDEDPATDATRLLFSTMVMLPRGQWKIDDLPVSINWQDIPAVELADSVLVSGREDVLQQLPVDWVSLQLPNTRSDYMSMSSGGICPLRDDLRSQTNWLISRVMSHDLELFSNPDRPPPLSLYEYQRKFLETLEVVGVGPDTLLGAQVLGKPGQSRLVDLSLVYSCPLVQDRLLSSASWDQPHQAEETLWALAVRFVVSDFIDPDRSVVPPSLRNGKLVKSMLALSPNPSSKVSLLPSVSMSLGLSGSENLFINEIFRRWSQEEGYELDNDPQDDDCAPPLAFALLLMIHTNDSQQPRITDTNAKAISRWCVEKIATTSELLENCVEGLIIPGLGLSTFPGVKNNSGVPKWSFISIIENLLPKLDKNDQQKVFHAGFDWLMGLISSKNDDLPATVACSFPFSCPLSKGTLDIERAQELMKVFSKMSLFAWPAIDDPEMEKIFSAFDPSVSTALRERFARLSKQALDSMSLPKNELAAVRKKIMLEAVVPLLPARAPGPPPLKF